MCRYHSGTKNNSKLWNLIHLSSLNSVTRRDWKISEMEHALLHAIGKFSQVGIKINDVDDTRLRFSAEMNRCLNNWKSSKRTEVPKNVNLKAHWERLLNRLNNFDYGP
jgi:hypothetical protein